MDIELNGVSETLLITLHIRAKDFQSEKSILKDEKAQQMVSNIN